MFQVHFFRRPGVALALACTLGAAQAQSLHVEEAWARATVPGQAAGSAFMTLRADTDLVLTGASSPAAEKAEIHTMEQDGDVMRMRALPELPLPAGQAVQLTPSGTHIMLMKLHQPLAEGDHVALTLEGRAPDGTPVTQSVDVPVRGIAARSAGHGHDMAGHEHGHEHEH